MFGVGGYSSLLVCWCVGVVVCWCIGIGVLVCWCVGAWCVYVFSISMIAVFGVCRAQIMSLKTWSDLTIGLF